MINKYEIKIINGEERLFLYFDFNYEFGIFKDKKVSIKKIIDNYIINNHIKYKGKIISLVIGGIIIGNIVLNKPIYNNDIKSNIIDINKIMYVPNISYVDNNQESLNEIVEDIIKDDNIKKNNVIVDKKDNSKEIIENDKKDNIEVDDNIYVEIKRKNGKIEKIELEEYIIGVVSAEMPALFHEEALKAQAVIARTYALKSIKNGKILTDNESTQSYKDNIELKNIWGSNFNNYYNKIKTCVLKTKGEYLTYKNEYIEAVYHSTSNGKTESSINVWNNYYPYLVSVESTYDYLNPSFIMEKEFTYQELSEKLNIEVNDKTDFQILKVNDSNRVESIKVDNKIYSGINFRNLLGLRSTDFEIKKNDDNLKIITKGYGHGVGLSQYGANGMAKNGYSYSNILKHYYKGVSINKK